MRYSLTPLKNGECQVRNYIAFHGCDDESTSTFYLYIWLIEGGDSSGERGENAGSPPIGRDRSRGCLPRIITHLHPDHYEYFDLFVNAQMVVNRRGFLEGLLGVRRNVMQALAHRWPESIRLVEDEEVLPGIRTLWLGCHSPCSQAIIVDTKEGRVALCGDVAYTSRNIEENIPMLLQIIPERTGVRPYNARLGRSVEKTSRKNEGVPIRIKLWYNVFVKSSV